jgi:hypothetical protein
MKYPASTEFQLIAVAALVEVCAARAGGAQKVTKSVCSLSYLLLLLWPQLCSTNMAKENIFTLICPVCSLSCLLLLLWSIVQHEHGQREHHLIDWPGLKSQLLAVAAVATVCAARTWLRKNINIITLIRPVCSLNCLLLLLCIATWPQV